MRPPVQQWMKTSEAAELLGCTTNAVRWKLTHGTLPVRYLKSDRVLRLNRRDFMRYLAAHTQTSGQAGMSETANSA